MISADIPITMTSTADSSLTIEEFIEYSIKNDLNIVTTKWLAHTRKITIAEAKAELKRFWDSTGRDKKYCATFSVLSLSESDGYLLQLIDSEEISKITNAISSEIYSVHAVPVKDKSVQFGLINVPIFDMKGEIEAPWIDSSKIPEIETTDYMASMKISNQKHPEIQSKADVQVPSASTNSQSQAQPADSFESQSQPPEKKMKTVPTVRTFMHNGYQMTEVVNELVPCDGDKQEDSTNNTAAVKPAAAPPAKSKQSSMMNFFKKK